MHENDFPFTLWTALTKQMVSLTLRHNLTDENSSHVHIRPFDAQDSLLTHDPIGTTDEKLYQENSLFFQPNSPFRCINCAHQGTCCWAGPWATGLFGLLLIIKGKQVLVDQLQRMYGEPQWLVPGTHSGLLWQLYILWVKMSLIPSTTRSLPSPIETRGWCPWSPTILG